MPEQMAVHPYTAGHFGFSKVPLCDYGSTRYRRAENRSASRYPPVEPAPEEKIALYPSHMGYFGQRGTSLSCPRARRDESQRSYRVRAASITAKYSRATGIWCCIAPHGRGTDSDFTRYLTGDPHQRPLRETL